MDPVMPNRVPVERTLAQAPPGTATLCLPCTIGLNWPGMPHECSRLPPVTGVPCECACRARRGSGGKR